MNEHDKKEIENLMWFKKELLRQHEEMKDLIYEERIKHYLAKWRGEK